jgi:hypothetical protein
MMKSGALIVLILAALLAGAVYVAIHMWNAMAGGPGMNGHGAAALIIGAIGSLALGVGLMALVFFSSRRGYDDAADLRAGRSEDPL